MINKLLLIGIYILCCVIAYGITFAYYQRRYPLIAKDWYYLDMRFAIFVSLTGPFQLVSQLLIHGIKYGVKFK